MISPEGRVVMISGASRGIGLAVARNLYQAGFSLSLGVRDIEAMRKTVDDWDTSRVLISKYDAVDKGTHKTWVDTTAEHYGRIDGLVNNAGIMQPVSVDDGEFNEKGLDLMWSVNVKVWFWTGDKRSVSSR